MIEEINIKLIIPHPNNPRLIKDDKFKKLVQSIKDFPEMLQVRPIVVDDNMIVLGGNMRLRAFIEAGLKRVPIIKASALTPEQQTRFIIVDNAGFGGFIAYSGSWIPTTDAGVIDDYQVRVTQTSGGFVGGTLATWLNMADGPHFWSVSEFYNGSNAASLTVEFRNAATGNIVESAFVQLEASF